jgi:hypothetical protein
LTGPRLCGCPTFAGRASRVAGGDGGLAGQGGGAGGLHHQLAGPNRCSASSGGCTRCCGVVIVSMCGSSPSPVLVCDTLHFADLGSARAACGPGSVGAGGLRCLPCSISANACGPSLFVSWCVVDRGVGTSDGRPGCGNANRGRRRLCAKAESEEEEKGGTDHAVGRVRVNGTPRRQHPPVICCSTLSQVAVCWCLCNMLPAEAP